jgi:hypothetical protein
LFVSASVNVDAFERRSDASIVRRLAADAVPLAPSASLRAPRRPASPLADVSPPESACGHSKR